MIELTEVTKVYPGDVHALAGGGYGVEVVDGSTTHYVKVTTGLYADGRVEITGDGLVEGTTVGMPR